jgi:flagellar hook-basal body protein
VAAARTFKGWQLAQMITKALAADAAWNDVTCEYDEKNQGFVFHSTKATPDTITLGSDAAPLRTLFNNIATNANNNTKDGTTLTNLTLNGSKQLVSGVRGNGAALVASSRRSGLEVTYAGGKFTFKSGTTGDASSIHLRATSDEDEATPVHTQGGLAAQKLLGLSADNTKTLTENNKNQVTLANLSLVENIPTVRGQKSQAAKMTGNAMGVDTEQAFNVTAANQSVTAVIDGITGNLKLSLGQYNIDTFVAELQTQINRMSDANGKTVNNVVVGFDSAKQALTITGSTTSSKSFIQMLGSQDWGLTDVPVAFGTTSTYAKIDTDTLVGSNLYVSQDPATGRWNESVDKADFDAGDIPYWTPIFLDRGEITFDTSGALVSPQAKYELESNAVTGNTIKLAYTGSTQYNSAFAAVSQSQNGKPEGDLNGISIADDGLIVASYSNGTQKSLGKIVIANFNSAAGLNQIGDSSWIASADSGIARLGEAGSAGFGTIRAGSRERSNVDLTNELVDLIAAQRNFQANAKAIETNSAMTSAIINIRG